VKTGVPLEEKGNAIYIAIIPIEYFSKEACYEMSAFGFFCRPGTFLPPCVAGSSQRAQAPNEITNSIGMKLLLIPKGTFMMGSTESEERRRPQESQHDVTLSKDYFLGAYEVTQSEYQQVMNNNPSFVQGGKIRDSSRHPVEQVSWKDAVEFCKRLSELPEEKRAGRVQRGGGWVGLAAVCRSAHRDGFVPSIRDADGGFRVALSSQSGIPK